MTRNVQKKAVTTDDLIRGTFLEEIIAIAKSGALDSVRDTPIKEGERLLCEATALEKACRIFAEGCKKRIREKIDSGISPDSHDVQDLQCRKEMGMQLFWDLLFDHLPDANKIRLRQGWQIVEKA
jgi:hypothetical protein